MGHELRQLLPRTFGPFLGSFTRLSEVQVRAIPPIMAGRDVLLAAPTASGKTEAFAAPLAEIVLATAAAPLRALIVSPTRALANDLKRRLEGRFDQVGLSFGLHTGEHKEQIGGRHPCVVVTTPEALDSLLARRAAALAATRLVVLDEIHILDGTARGDQLRILLHRLEALAQEPPQFLAASATIESPEQLAARYLRDPVLVLVAGTRAIRVKAFPGSSPTGVVQHLTELANHGSRKVLVFCNRRASVEDYATRLRGRTPYGDLVFPHHGSLARNQRERTERLFLEAPTGVVVSTMTLEMGIDIGSVDYVLLLHPPPSVASLLQRIGRGNRRTGTTRGGYVVDDDGQALVFRTMFQAASKGCLLGQPYAFRPSVLLQQALVLTGSRGWIDARFLERAMPAFVWDEVRPTTPSRLLTALVEAEQLQPSNGNRFVLTEPTELRYDRGVLHSNIEDSLVLEVIDRITGDVVGEVPPQTQRRLRLGGRSREVVVESSGRLLTDAKGKSDTPVFRPRGIPTVTLAFAQRVVQALGAAPGTLLQIPHAGSVVLAHGLGTIGGLFLQKLLQAKMGNGFVPECTPFTMRLRQQLPGLPAADEDAVDSFVHEHLGRLGQLCGMGPRHSSLPEELQVQAVHRASCLHEVVEVMRGVRVEWVQSPTEALTRKMAAL
ncbi:MAG: DEAD/DEAH box helicase [Planctomycetes bacterium]|nr:DEAD/DEAH box helicase [Planctomycetota bacterium]